MPSLNVLKTSGVSAEITWTRHSDPQGYLARAIESERLSGALMALAASDTATLAAISDLKTTASQTAAVARDLERRTRTLAVLLRDQGMSWRELASTLYDDPDMHSSARRVYEAGLRQAGLGATVGDTDDG